MSKPEGREWRENNLLVRIISTVRRAMSEFLAIPTAIIVGFLLLSLATYLLDKSDIQYLSDVRLFFRSHIFANAQATSGLLGAIAASLITVSSFTFTLLLLAVQQPAGALTPQVVDQFLRRRFNQAFFGFFLGLALFALITLSTVGAPFNPVFGATLVLLLTIVAFYFLILLFYTSVDQMRPTVIIEAIHDHTLKARRKQLDLIDRTYRVSHYDGPIKYKLTTEDNGFMVGLDVDAIAQACKQAEGKVEVALSISFGTYLAFGDELAVIKARSQEDAEKVGEAVQRAIRIDRQRDFNIDTAYGLEQLEIMAWTSISTAKSNPAPGIQVIRSLRDLLARWSAQTEGRDSGLAANNEDEAEDGEAIAPIVYHDNVPVKIMNTFESLALVSTESMQHQSLAEVFQAFAMMLNRLPDAQQERVEDATLRILSGMGDHMLTNELDDSISALVAALRESGRAKTAYKVETARNELACSIGNLNSRATRVPKAK